MGSIIAFAVNSSDRVVPFVLYECLTHWRSLCSDDAVVAQPFRRGHRVQIIDLTGSWCRDGLCRVLTGNGLVLATSGGRERALEQAFAEVQRQVVAPADESAGKVLETADGGRADATLQRERSAAFTHDAAGMACGGGDIGQYVTCQDAVLCRIATKAHQAGCIVGAAGDGAIDIQTLYAGSVDVVEGCGPLLIAVDVNGQCFCVAVESASERAAAGANIRVTGVLLLLKSSSSM